MHLMLKLSVEQLQDLFPAADTDWALLLQNNFINITSTRKVFASCSHASATTEHIIVVLRGFIKVIWSATVFEHGARHYFLLVSDLCFDNSKLNECISPGSQPHGWIRG